MNFQDWEILNHLSEKFLATVEMALVFGDDNDRAILLTSDDRVLSLGRNCYGCLGFDSIDIYHQLPKEIPTLCKKGVKELVVGGDIRWHIFLFAYLDSGKFYWWGYTPFSSDSAFVSIPEQIWINSNIRVRTIACGAWHCAILSEDGKVFTWGQNKFGQLGHTNCFSIRDTFGTDTPSRVEGIIEDQTVISISCGNDFTVVLLDNGKVVTWGNNKEGQLGLGGWGSTSDSPVEVSSLQVYYDYVFIEKIAAGRCHVLALSNTGTLYVWGSNYYHQLGVSYPFRDYGCPVEVNNLRFSNIGASYRHNISVAQSRSGKVYMWGQTEKGILTEPTETECKSINEVFLSFAVRKTMMRPMRRLELFQNLSNESSELETVQPTTVVETLEKEFNNPDNSNLKIIVDDRAIHVHRDILAMRSPYFNVIISRWMENNEPHSMIPIEKQSYAAVEAYLKFLYTDKLDVDLNLAVDLLQLADEYGDDNFRFHCEKIIKRKITSDTVADILALTSKLEKSKNLNAFCLDFALQHATEVISSPGFETWDSDLLKKFMKGYVTIKGNCQ